jgi:hypothetical protein
MLKVLAIAALTLTAQEPGQWQDFGAGPDGTRLAVNLDSIEAGEQGPEAMVRVRYARPQADGATQADIRTVFDCQARRVKRYLMGQTDARGQIVARSDEGQQMEAVPAPANSALGKVLDLVCATAEG